MSPNARCPVKRKRLNETGCKACLHPRNKAEREKPQRRYSRRYANSSWTCTLSFLPCQPREIAEVCYIRYARRPDHKSVKHIATSGPPRSLQSRRYQPWHQISEVKSARRLETHFRSPQLDLWQLSETEWLLALRWPEPIARKKSSKIVPLAEQLMLASRLAQPDSRCAKKVTQSHLLQHIR